MIWLIGAGGMSADYVEVLKAQNEEFLVIGRGKESARTFEINTGQPVISGGLAAFLKTNPTKPKAVIVSVGVEELYNTTVQILELGVTRILVEKPAGLNYSEIQSLDSLTVKMNAELYVAYNRRFYSAVLCAQKLIKADGGVTSFNFEMTEWSHKIKELNKKQEVFETWFIGNSTHVTDLAFFLGGKPVKFDVYTAGSLSWHTRSSIFAGAGISETGALFNYGANWESAGRWSVEVLTNKNRYIFRPMEVLSVQKRGTIQQVEVEIDYSLDHNFKPGLYLQVESFLAGNNENLCSINEQLSMISIYEKMANYD